MTRIAFATFAGAPEIADDDRLAVDAFSARGVDVIGVPWDGPDALPDALQEADVSGLVLRSCWNYHRAPERFHAWLDALERANVPVVNATSLARWNLSKVYFRDLAARSVAVPTSVFVPPGDPRSLRDVIEEAALDEVVVKPWISMNGWDTWRSSRTLAASHEAAWRALVATRGMLVQRYLREIEQGGELSFVFFGGVFSHALRKVPRAGEFRVQVEYGGARLSLRPSASLIEQARAILEAAPCATTYGRVDGVEVDGRLHLMELEVLDPTLFFEIDPWAAERFAEAVVHGLLTPG